MPDCYMLSIDQDLCVDCGSCEKILPTFKTKYNGIVKISEGMYSDEMVKESIKSVINACTENAIIFLTL